MNNTFDDPSNEQDADFLLGKTERDFFFGSTQIDCNECIYLMKICDKHNKLTSKPKLGKDAPYDNRI